MNSAFRFAAVLVCVFLACLGFEARGQGLPVGWSSLDIGGPGLAGSGAHSGGTWTVRGGGADVWGTTDQFQFTSLDLSGDGSVVARVASVENTGTYAKAGVMIRGGTAADAAYAFVFVTPSAAGFECRPVSGASTVNVGGAAGSAPRWVKLTRVGARFTSYVSGDGVTWTQLGSSQSLVIPTAAKAGLAVCAYNNAVLNTSTFTNVTATRATSSRVNLAKYQSASADSGANPQLAMDGNVGTAWQSSGAGPHFVVVTLPGPTQLGSAQLYLGSDDTGAPSNLSLLYFNGSAWVPVPGGSFTGNTATVRNVVFTSPVTATAISCYSTDASLKVREVALFAESQPIGCDVTLNLARKKLTTFSSANGTNYAKNMVDGFVGGDASAWKTSNVNGAHWHFVDLGEWRRIGSAHLYSGSESAAAVSDFRLQYWTGSAWADVPGGVISGNTQKDLVVNFTAPVATNQINLVIAGNGTQTVRELTVFPASSGITSFPIGTSVFDRDPTTTKWDDRGDGFWNLVNRANSAALISSATGTGFASATTSEAEQQYQLLYNYDSGAYRVRNRASGRCLSAAGTAVVEADYTAQPHQLWRIVDAGGGYSWLVNVASGFVLTSAGTVAQATTVTQQQWQLVFSAIYPKKGLADYGWHWAKVRAKWNYDWSKDPIAYDQPADSAFSPMQWNGGGIETLPTYYNRWHTDGKPIALLGFNEPDFAEQANMSVASAVSLWPQLDAMDLPLVSPVPAITFSQWENDFFGAVESLGLRVDYTAVHWYGSPNAAGLISFLNNVYTTYGRPVWLTEFSTVDWANTATWTEEDNYKFMAEFLWMAEEHSWLKRYAAFAYDAPAPATPWEPSGPTGTTMNTAGVLTAVGDVYAGWDGDRTVRNNTAYILHGKGSALHLGNNGAIRLGTVRENGTDMQWALVPTTFSPYIVHLVSLRDGRRLWSDGTNVGFASAGTTGSAVEWAYTHVGNGYYVLNHGQSVKRLRMNRTNDASGAPTTTWLSMDVSSSTDNAAQFRFIKPAVAADIADLPAGWSAQDIGEPQQRGSAFFDSTNGAWTVTGGGADIFSVPDQFQFVSEGFAGDGTFIARVGSVQNTSPYAKAGVMFRDGVAEDAMFAHVFVGPGTVGFEYRAATGVAAQGAAHTGGTAPMWLKLVRTGNSFSGFYSADGVMWTQLGAAQTVPMALKARAGLAVTSHDVASVNVSTFTNVSVLPPGWSDADIGGPAGLGGASFSSDTGTWGVSGGGADVWGTTDQFHFAMRNFAGDGSVVARVNTVGNSNPYAKAGVMMRSSTGANSRNAFVLAGPGGVSFQTRAPGGGSTTEIATAAVTAPVWLRLTRSGTSYTGWYSTDGAAWTQLGTAQTITMSATPMAGLAVNAHDNATLNTSTFSNVSFLGTGWSSADVGAVGIPGGSVLDPATGAWSLTASGTDIWNTADQMQLAYQSLAGDSVIVARVAALQNTDAYAKAGVMMRSSTGTGSRNAAVVATPSGVLFHTRSVSDGTTSLIGSAAVTAPVWVRLVRSGTSYTGWYSADGLAWTRLGTPQTLTMSATPLAGLVVTSHNATALHTATLDNVSLATLPAGFSSWAAFQNANFNTTQLANPAISGPLADANSDSLKNLLAYAFGLSPWTVATTANGGIPTAQDQDGYLTLTYTRLRNPIDVSYTIEVTSDLTTWNSGPAFTTQLTVTPLDASREQVTIRDNAPMSGATRRVMRVKVTIP